MRDLRKRLEAVVDESRRIRARLEDADVPELRRRAPLASDDGRLVTRTDV